jgi:oligopeptidase B
MMIAIDSAAWWRNAAACPRSLTPIRRLPAKLRAQTIAVILSPSGATRFLDRHALCSSGYPRRLVALSTVEPSMSTFSLSGVFLIMTLPLSSLAATLPPPPDAAQKSHQVKAPHGAVRNDEYYWLRDDKREDKAMLAYLDAENAYADAVMAPLKPLQETLYNEIVGRIKQDDDSVPYRERGWWYFSRFQAGNDYPVYLRAKAAADGRRGKDDQVLLDLNVLAKDKNYYNVGDMAVTQDNSLLAYAEDDNGRRQYTVRIKNLDTGELYPDEIKGVSPNLIWADDNRTLFYVENDPETLLTVRVKKHVLGTPASADVLVYEEKDDSFYMGISRTRDDSFICIGVESTVSTEMRCAPAADPKTFTVFAPRERDVEYNADHLDGRWVIHTNAPGTNGKPRMERVGAAP